MAGAIGSMLDPSCVRILESAATWEEAVAAALAPLVDGGYVEARYIQGVIDNAREFGPYFVICPDLALLHARPEQGAVKTQIGLTVVREPVFFKPEGPGVRVLVSLAATGADEHLEVMRELAAMFADASRIERIATAATCEEAIGFFTGRAS